MAFQVLLSKLSKVCGRDRSLVAIKRVPEQTAAAGPATALSYQPHRACTTVVYWVEAAIVH